MEFIPVQESTFYILASKAEARYLFDRYLPQKNFNDFRKSLKYWIKVLFQFNTLTLCYILKSHPYRSPHLRKLTNPDASSVSNIYFYPTINLLIDDVRNSWLSPDVERGSNNRSSILDIFFVPGYKGSQPLSDEQINTQNNTVFPCRCPAKKNHHHRKVVKGKKITTNNVKPSFLYFKDHSMPFTGLPLVSVIVLLLNNINPCPAVRKYSKTYLCLTFRSVFETMRDMDKNRACEKYWCLPSKLQKVLNISVSTVPNNVCREDFEDLPLLK